MASKPIVSGGSGVYIEGLNDFNRGLKYAANAAPKAMAQANYDVANTLVGEAKKWASVRGGVAPKAAKSLRASKTAAYASIRGGGVRAPYFYGAEFGAKRYKQFHAWRGNGWAGWAGGPGYFLHPAIKAKSKKAVDKYMEAMERITAQAFPL